VKLSHQLGADQVIFKNLDVITKESDDQRHIFSHTEHSKPELEAELAAARKKADELGIRLRLYSLQPVEQAVCEHNPLKSLFFNWEGYLSPCITLSYAEERIFAGEKVRVGCQRFGNINAHTLEEMLKQTEYVELRQRFQGRIQSERHAALQAILQSSDQVQMPPAPEACRTCYYLYGI
jgi:hypothetical protein